MLLKLLNKTTIGLLSVISFASAMANEAGSEPQSLANINTKLAQELCPPVESMTQNADNTWSAPGGWKSNSPSFLKSITSFVGAQWIGVNLGEIICIYSKGGKNRFPVNLQRPQLTVSPTGGGWTADKGGYKDCNAVDPKQCRFFTTRADNSHTDLYEQINFYKGSPIDSDY